MVVGGGAVGGGAEVYGFVPPSSSRMGVEPRESRLLYEGENDLDRLLIRYGDLLDDLRNAGDLDLDLALGEPCLNLLPLGERRENLLGDLDLWSMKYDLLT